VNRQFPADFPDVTAHLDELRGDVCRLDHGSHGSHGFGPLCRQYQSQISLSPGSSIRTGSGSYSINLNLFSMTRGTLSNLI